ncbi:MAG: porin [Bacteroidales bacterium]|nr:porin [Bacteroidales bacterium]
MKELFASCFLVMALLLSLPLSAQKSTAVRNLLKEDSLIRSGNMDEDLAAKIRNMPNITVGKGISFMPKDSLFKVTMRFRMQNLLGFAMDEDFRCDEVTAMVKRLRLRFDGFILTQKLQYSIQLGFSPYDSETLPNGNMNIIRDAMVYYVPNSHWSIGFGQTKIKANRARTNSSSALQFVDRSIVNSTFNVDRDFGFFGDYNTRLFKDFNIVAKASITSGEGRNWGVSKHMGFAYTGRLELYPLGRFKAFGDVFEGDYERESVPRFMVAGAYSYNQKATRVQGQRGAVFFSDQTRNLGSYFVDFIFKYSGFAFYADYMGRTCSGGDPELTYVSPDDGTKEFQSVYVGSGLNVQTSYIFPKNWEIALRNSTLFPKEAIKSRVNYDYWNQTTIGFTKYLIGHNLKLQADASYNQRKTIVPGDYNKWEFRFQVELGI